MKQKIVFLVVILVLGITDFFAQNYNYYGPKEFSSYSSSSSSRNSYGPSSSSSSYSSNTNSKYKALSDPDLVDNSEKIKESEKAIKRLEAKKKDCYLCHGSGKVPGNYCTMCKGTGTIKLGYYTPQFYSCTWCGGKGRTETFCSECKQTDISISVLKQLMTTLKETHGMTKEVLKTYTEVKAREHNQNMEHQRAIDAIAEPYLNSTRKRISSHGMPSSSCSICNGTGVDPFPWDENSSFSKFALPLCYINQSGKKCPYCKKIIWHQHAYCSKCKADKYR